jgi:hypothetical protein
VRAGADGVCAEPNGRVDFTLVLSSVEQVAGDAPLDDEIERWPVDAALFWGGMGHFISAENSQPGGEAEFLEGDCEP